MEIIRSYSIQVKHYKRRMAEAVCQKCKSIVTRQYSNAKNQSSCGCDRKELRGAEHYCFKHGRTPKKLYQKWRSMNDRCRNENNNRFHRYGGRGITVCEEWMDFTSFKEWAIKFGWNEQLEIDRVNNDGNYEPQNCRFVTRAKNCQNKGNNKLSIDSAREIRRLHASGMTISEIERHLKESLGIKISWTMVKKVIQNKSWFDEEYAPLPYPVYSVETNELIQDRKQEDDE